jgi:hypothetical protein
VPDLNHLVQPGKYHLMFARDGTAANGMYANFP